MKDKMKRLLIGRPLENEEIATQKYSTLWGLPILASDPISSIAYASEEVLLVLVPVVGALAFSTLSYISLAIIGLLVMLTFSYRQTIQAYPNGGGAYIVASDNLGLIPGITAGASLAIDYVLTVAVSISSGTAAICSAFPVLLPFTVPICLCLLALIMVGNLRGIKESSRMFGFPTYAFILAVLIMIVIGIFDYATGAKAAVPPTNVFAVSQSLSMILILKAFANGCAALTGVEAVSNAVPNFKEPHVKNASRVLLILSGVVLVLFGGTALLINLYQIVPLPGKTVLSLLAAHIFGHGFMFYFIQATTAIILAMAANTSYSDFPMLLSLIAKDGFAPRQLSMRGDRLSFSNGILVLSALAALLIVIFRGNTTALIPLYAIGVFISFTLSQFGMFKKWVTKRGEHWVHKAVINGLGALVTSIVVLIIAFTKFRHGAWIVIIVLPVLVFMMLKVKKHYLSVAQQLRIEPEELATIDTGSHLYGNRVIVPIESINHASIRALRYAKTISDNIIAFNVSIDEENGKKLKEKYALMKTDIPLIVRYSPFRKIAEPLLAFIASEEYGLKNGNIITVIIPQFEVKKWWHRFLHNRSGAVIERELLKHKEIVIATMPLQLEKEDQLFKQRTSPQKK